MNTKNDTELLTIAEYARLRGVSTTSVYKRLGKGLQPWVRVVNGKKYILSSILDDDQYPRVDNVVNENQHEVVNVENQVDNRLIDVLTAEIDRLWSENEAQRATIREKDQQLQDFAVRFADLAQQAQQITAQAQTLHAADKPRLMAAHESQDIPATASTSDVAEDGDQSTADPEPEKKRGFWARLFGFD